MAYFTVTSGGSALSTGDNSAPHTVNGLNATLSEVGGVAQLTVSTPAGSKTSGTVTISLTGAYSDRWRLSWNGTTWAGWGANLTTTNAITSAGTAIYIQARALPTDTRGRDDSVDLHVAGTIIKA